MEFFVKLPTKSKFLGNSPGKRKKILTRILDPQISNQIDVTGTHYRIEVVGKRPLEAQTKESARRDKRPSPGYCVAICFYYAALGHMFLLCGAWPYVSIGWLW